MVEISLGTLLMAVQAVEHEIQDLDDEITALQSKSELLPEVDERESMTTEICDAQEMHFSYVKAAEELEQAYREAHVNVINFPSYDDLMARLRNLPTELND